VRLRRSDYFYIVWAFVAATLALMAANLWWLILTRWLK
jgi:hypothetical protein